MNMTHLNKLSPKSAVLLFSIALLVVLAPVSHIPQQRFIQIAEAASWTDLTQRCQNLIACERSDMTTIRQLLAEENSRLSQTQKNFLRSKFLELGGSASDLKPPESSSCNFSKDLAPFFDPGCWLRTLGALTTSIFVYIGVKLLTLAGYLFNFLVDYTIVDFKGAIYDKIGSAVELGWTAFRDIANIIIIGIFTFTAISIIVGLKEFGQKKMIARVLIIAVLINFSLLFTKMIIDASNFTAIQFYNASLAQVAGPGVAGGSTSVTIADASAIAGTAAATAGVTSSGIAGQFMQTIGITGFADSYNDIRKIQEKEKNGLIGIGFGILSLIYLLGAAIVLFYGCFLLISRAILLIFLMLTASVAFASYLVPTWETSRYGWKTWWSSLLKTAVFAPILMIFLWITLNIAQKLAVDGKTLGGVATEPGSNMAAVFSYIMILGLLFLSFKLSSSFAGKIAGFNIAGSALKFAAGVPLALGVGLAGSVLRKGGRLAALGAESADKRLTQATRLRAQMDATKYPKEHAQLGKMIRGLERSKSVGGFLSKSSFALGNTGLGKTLAKAAGVSPKLMGEGAKGFGVKAQETADAAAKRAAEVTVSDETARAAARKEVAEKQDRRERREAIKQQRDANAAIVQTEQETAKTTKDNEQLLSKLATAKQTVQVVENEASKEKVAVRDRHDPAIQEMERQFTAAQDGQAKDNIREQIIARKTQRENELKQQDVRINEARGTLNTIQSRIDTIDAPLKAAEEKFKKSSEEYEKFVEEDERLIDQRKKEIVEQGKALAQDFAGDIAHGRMTNIIPRALGEDVDNDYTARLARKSGKKKIRIKDLSERELARRQALTDAGENGPASPAPSAGTTGT